MLDDPSSEPAARVALPAEAELTEAFGALEGLLLAASDHRAEAAEVAEIAARLRFIAEPDRGGPPAVAMGQQLPPLSFPVLDARSFRVLGELTSELIADNAPPGTHDVLHGVADRHPGGTIDGEAISRAVALVQIDHGSDMLTLERLYPEAALARYYQFDRPLGFVSPVALDADEIAAYRRVLDRCAAVWRPGRT